MTAKFHPKMNPTTADTTQGGVASVTGTTQAVALEDRGGATILFTNTHASNICYLNFGTASVVATTSSPILVLPLNQILMTRPSNNATHFAAIGSGSLTLHYALGN